MTDPAATDWRLFTGDDTDRDEHALNLARVARLPDPPPWRRFDTLDRERARSFLPEPDHINRVNAALYLRRPLLVTGNPGTGKTTLVYAVARELGLGPVLRWSITSRSTLKDGLYEYDAVARLQDAYLSSQAPEEDQPPTGQDSVPADPTPAPSPAKDPADIGPYLTLGPLGTAFYANEHRDPDTGKTRYFPRVLLIDEIDKSDIDLPNDLLHVFEEGRFEIPELVRLKDKCPDVQLRAWGRDAGLLPVHHGEVKCQEFPLVVMTSNGERDFPPAFLRRCLQLRMQPPDKTRLEQIVRAHLFAVPANASDAEQAAMEERWRANADEIGRLIETFLEYRDKAHREQATDQLLNAVQLALSGVDLTGLLDAVYAPLSGAAD
jgi:MoxR-like ATPase